MKIKKTIKEIGVYALAFVVAHTFFWKVIIGGPKIGRFFSLLRPFYPPEYAAELNLIILFLPSFLVSILLIYIFTKNLKKSVFISIIINALIFFILALTGLSSALR